MATIEELEETISNLPPGEFYELMGWMFHRHLDVLSADGFESPELEQEMLKALDGVPIPADELFFDQLHANLASKARNGHGS